MSLVADYSSSSSDSDEDSSVNEEENQSTNELNERNSVVESKPKLPSASDLLSRGGNSTGEVFNNPYKKAEDEKFALLEKHVKMVNTEEHLREKNGKKICWNFRKGRCRFGSNCTFAHDSDLQVDFLQAAGSSASDTNVILNEKKTQEKYQQHIPKQSIIMKPQSGLQLTSSSGGNNSDLKLANTKRQRPGLGDSITPSKKVMKQYNTQK